MLLAAAIALAFGSLIITGVAFADDPASTSSTTTTEVSSTTTMATEPVTTTATEATTTTTEVSSTTTTTPVLAAAATLTRYDQTNSAISYAGTWAAFTTAAAHNGSYARASTTGASANIVFDGTQLHWIGMKGTTTGVADVYLDGAFVKTINLANSVAIYQQDVWSTGTLPSGVHTVRIVRNASSASGKYITVDAVDVAGTLVKCQWAEQDNSLLAYKGSWTSQSGTAYSGGGDTYASSAAASMTVSFTGTYLAWVGQKASTCGVAKVTLDGTQTFTVDQYSAATLYQQKLWDTGQLSPGAHTVTIDWTGTKNGLSTGTSVRVDGFLVAGTVTQAYVWNRFEDGDSHLLYWGTWTTNSGPQASGGSDKRANTSQAMVTVTFTGAQLDWIATTGPGMGTADVSVDNGAAQPVDLSGSTTRYQQKVWSTGMLAAGTHTVGISWDENDTAGAYIDVDAFDVLGTLPSTPVLTATQIKWAEQKLSDLSYRPGTIDGVIDSKTQGAVTAFEKWEGLTRDGKITSAVFSRLQNATRPKPSKSGGTNPWIEVNKTKQVLLYCKNGAVVWTLPVSTGSASVGEVTPSGTFKVVRKTLETSPRYLPLYILPSPSLLAIHGYPNVPTSPASHGCIRTELWDQDDFYPLISVGIYVYIY